MSIPVLPSLLLLPEKCSFKSLKINAQHIYMYMSIHVHVPVSSVLSCFLQNSPTHIFLLFYLIVFMLAHLFIFKINLYLELDFIC